MMGNMWVTDMPTYNDHIFLLHEVHMFSEGLSHVLARNFSHALLTYVLYLSQMFCLAHMSQNSHFSEFLARVF